MTGELDESDREFFSKVLADIDEVEQLSQDIGMLLESKNDSDFILVANKHEFQLHKEILSVRSDYFK